MAKPPETRDVPPSLQKKIIELESEVTYYLSDIQELVDSTPTNDPSNEVRVRFDDLKSKVSHYSSSKNSLTEENQIRQLRKFVKLLKSLQDDLSRMTDTNWNRDVLDQVGEVLATSLLVLKDRDPFLQRVCAKYTETLHKRSETDENACAEQSPFDWLSSSILNSSDRLYQRNVRS